MRRNREQSANAVTPSVAPQREVEGPPPSLRFAR